MGRIVGVVAAVTVALVLGACADDSSDGGDVSGTTTEPDASTTTATDSTESAPTSTTTTATEATTTSIAGPSTTTVGDPPFDRFTSDEIEDVVAPDLVDSGGWVVSFDAGVAVAVFRDAEADPTTGAGRYEVWSELEIDRTPDGVHPIWQRRDLFAVDLVDNEMFAIECRRDGIAVEGLFGVIPFGAAETVVPRLAWQVALDAGGFTEQPVDDLVCVNDFAGA